ncbi:DUF4115 domain-containing protein [bacterium]|nr:MAG: DUF4115 domain-containing protein [bacterium]
MDDLPATVYVKGFLRSLAQIYHSDPEVLLRQFVAERGIEDNLHMVEKAEERKARAIPRQLIITPKILAIAGLSLLGILSLGYLYFQVSSLRRPPPLEIVSPAADGTAASSLILVQGKTERGSSVYINDQLIVVDADGNFRENLSLGLGVNQLNIRSVNKFKQETRLVRSVVLAEGPAAGVTASSTGSTLAPKLGLEVSVGPKASVVLLVVDGREDFAGIMLPDAKKLITATEKIVLSTSNAGSTRVKLNGKDLGVMGKDGEIVKDIEFTP